MMIILQSQECSYETNYHDISKTIRWHSKLGCHLIIFSLLLCCHRRKPKAKESKEDITKPLDSCEEKCAAIGGTVVPPSECHCKILYLLENQPIKADFRGYTFFDVFAPLPNTLIDTKIWVYETIK